MVGPLEATILWALAIWAVFFVANHAELTRRVREAVLPVLPRWLASLLTCPFCISWWGMLIFCIGGGYTPLLLTCPPIVLIIDKMFVKLSK